MDDGILLPALRGIDVTPFHGDDGVERFALRDNGRIAPHPLAVTLPGYFILAHLNGHTRVGQVRAAFAQQFGAQVSGAQIGELVTALDEALFLDTQRFRAAYEERRRQYAAADARDNRDRWPSAAALQAEADELFSHPVVAASGLRGVIAPHLDYARGGPCYGPAYARLRHTPADCYVILGTNHYGRSRSVVATGKDFLTPLGRATTDRALLQRLETALGAPICAGELDHDAEHSIELQVHLLQACFPRHSFSILPVLCPDPSGPTGTRPADGRGPDLGEFADALRDCVAGDPRSIVIIASADFSHVGQRFGDDQPTTSEFLQDVWTYDRKLLELLAGRQEDEFVRQVSREDNRTRICSVGCVYALLRALPGANCEILHYHQAIDMSTETHVTCAAAVLQ